MLNIVTELIGKRALEMDLGQTLTTVLVLKNPNKNTKKGAPTGRYELRITRTSVSFDVRFRSSTPWSGDDKGGWSIPTDNVAPFVQKMLTPLKLLGFEAGQVWTIA